VSLRPAWVLLRVARTKELYQSVLALATAFLNLNHDFAGSAIAQKCRPEGRQNV